MIARDNNNIQQSEDPQLRDIGIMSPTKHQLSDNEDDNDDDEEPQPTYISPSPPPKMMEDQVQAATTTNSPIIKMPLKTDPNNNLPFILQKQQLLTKSKDGRVGTQIDQTSKLSNEDLKDMK